jgi:hypothetical protein
VHAARESSARLKPNDRHCQWSNDLTRVCGVATPAPPDHGNMKNKSGDRDPQMHQTARGKQWLFGFGEDSYAELEVANPRHPL